MSQLVEGPLHKGEHSRGRPVQSMSQVEPFQQSMLQAAGAPAQSNRHLHPVVEQELEQPPEQSTAQQSPEQTLQSASQSTQAPPAQS